MTEPPVPTFFAGLRSFSFAPRGPWFAEATEPVDIAEQFHDAAKISRTFQGQALGPAWEEIIFEDDVAFALGRKVLAQAGPQIPLPPAPALPLDLRSITHRRRSSLPDPAGAVPLPSLATILALAAGRSPERPGLRVIPSGGAMYPLDVVVVAHAVEGLAPGAYVYDPIEHALLPRGDLDPVEFHTQVCTLAAPPQPAVTLAVVATFARSRAKYGLRGYRFALIEAGHLVQAAVTVATAVALESLPWGGFVDDAADALLDLDGLERSCIYLLGISAPGPGPGGERAIAPTTDGAPA